MRLKLLALFKEYWLLGLILFVTFINGLLFVFVVPPWQHYDEPSNFEYAWLIANRPGFPQPGDYDASMRRQVAESMSKHGFYGRGNPGPDFNSLEDPIDIGISQIDDRPFAYWAASLPLHLMKTRSVTNQLYAGRLVSLIFYLITVASAWGIMREVSPVKSHLRWVFPLSLSLFPGMANLMTSLNNDAAAVAIFSLFLWGSVRIIRKGFSIFGLMWVSSTAVFCYYTKITVYFALLLLPLVLIFTGLNGKRRVWKYGFMSSSIFIVLFSIFSVGDAASWYRATVQLAPTRSESAQAIAGRYVFHLDAAAETYPNSHRPLFQPIRKELISEMKGSTVTLGAWIWSTQPGEAITPIFGDGIKNYSKKIKITTEPTFYAFQAKVNESSFRAYVLLPANITPNEAGVSLFYDSIILVLGERPVNEVPELSDDDAVSGYWGGEPFTNLLRNSSAEAGTIRVQSWLDDVFRRFTTYYTGPSFNLHYLLDFKNIFWHFQLTIHRLFSTFWGQFGWGHVPLLLGSKPYRLMALLTFFAVFGAVVFALRNRKTLPWVFVLIFGLSILGIWGMAYLRSTGHLSVPWFYLPVARYGYPAIIPTMLMFGVGIIELLRIGMRWFHTPPITRYLLYLGLILFLNVVSLYSIVKFYYL
jgi:hypothetical protein